MCTCGTAPTYICKVGTFRRTFYTKTVTVAVFLFPEKCQLFVGKLVYAHHIKGCSL